MAKPCHMAGVLLLYLFTTACSTLSEQEKHDKRAQLDAMAEQAIARLVENDASISEHIERAKGYLVADMKLTKVPVVGAGGGEGVFVDKDRGTRQYIDVSRFDLGGGWGARAYKALLVIDTDENMERMRGGIWEYQAGVEASAGSASAEGSSAAINEGYKMYVLPEVGASATATARVIRIRINTGLSED